jgi:hypothetical protein
VVIHRTDPCIGELVETPAAASWSYREYNVEHGSPECKAWETWFRAHDLPLAQIPFQGWAARDVHRNTVSVKVFSWAPGDEDKPKFGEATVVYLDKDDDGVDSGAKDARYGVFTQHLNVAPLPFPPA